MGDDDTRLDRLVEREAGIKGRSLDPRQDAYMPDLSDEFGDLWWGAWTLRTPSEGGADQHHAAFPLVAVGHEDLARTEWETFLQQLHEAVYPKQATRPPYGVDAEASEVEVHRFTKGDYLPPMRASYPESVDKLKDVSDIADRVLYHPMGHPHLEHIEGREWKAKALHDKLIEIADDKLVRPQTDDATMGDILNRISHPFGTSSLY